VANVIQSWQPPSEAAVWLHLLDVEGFVPLGDKRLAQFARRIGKGLQQIWLIGGYAVPLTPAELGPTRKIAAMALQLRPGIAEIAPYVGGEASLPAWPSRPSSPPTRILWGRAPRPSPPSARLRSISIAIPMAGRSGCAPASPGALAWRPSRSSAAMARTS
jgi:hypothetical protein